jgi:hypothetical protein
VLHGCTVSNSCSHKFSDFLGDDGSSLFLKQQQKYKKSTKISKPCREWLEKVRREASAQKGEANQIQFLASSPDLHQRGEDQMETLGSSQFKFRPSPVMPSQVKKDLPLQRSSSRSTTTTTDSETIKSPSDANHMMPKIAALVFPGY